MVPQFSEGLELAEDRFFDPPAENIILARRFYEYIRALPILSPHTHIDIKLFTDEAGKFDNPAEVFIQRDHYILRLLHANGIPLEALGIPRKDGRAVESDPRQVWRNFCSHFHLFRGTPSRIWIEHTLQDVFGVKKRLSDENALQVYDHIEDCLKQPEFTPRALLDKFNVEVLCTTDPAESPLQNHLIVRDMGLRTKIAPTFRPDNLINIDHPDWRAALTRLCQTSAMDVVSYGTFIQALERRREAFRSLGAVASDHGVESPFMNWLSPVKADAIFQQALRGRTSPEDAALFRAHALMEMARMSSEDGLVMQLHAGALRNHNREAFQLFGADIGFDLPLQTEFTRNLRPLLERFGRNSRFRLILFTLDESAYSRELAPLAGVYPAVRLGPPWWFLDSLNGMRRYFDAVIETAGLYKTSGFNDDARNFFTIPARHDLWRRASANWLAGLCLRKILPEDEAVQMAEDLAVNLARRAYRLEN